MSKIYKKFLNKKIIFFTCIFFILATLLKIYSLKVYGFFNNDDIAYFKLSENLFSGNGFVFDIKELVPNLKNNHVGNHIHFPPGYPIILGIESFVLKTPKVVRSFEWIFLGILNSVLLLNLCWLLAPRRKYIAVLLTSLIPVFVYGIGTITIGSENWFLTTSMIGLIFCFKFTRTNKLIFLILSNTFFSLTYLIRPEGILFYSSTLMASFFHIKEINVGFKKLNNEKVFEFTIIACCFLIPFALIIFPYIIYLFQELGIITLTGKSLNWSELNTLKSPEIISNYISNAVVLFDTIFMSPNFLGISFSFISFVIFLSFLIKPKSLDLKNIKRNIKDILILSSPIPFCIYTYIKYDPYGRSIFCFIPILIIIVLIFSEIYGKVFDYKKIIFFQGKKIIEFSPLISFLTILSIFNSIYPIFYSSFMINRPTYYYNAVDRITSNSNSRIIKSINVWSRDLTSSLYNERINTCNDINIFQDHNEDSMSITSTNKACPSNIDYFLLTDISHDSMPKPTSWEINKLNENDFLLKGVKYEKDFQLSNKNNTKKIIGFKKYNISENY